MSGDEETLSATGGTSKPPVAAPLSSTKSSRLRNSYL